jgi:hypothetical protein
MLRKFGGLFLLIFVFLVTSGCTRYISNSAQDKQTGFILLDNQTSIGQTFTARFAGLAGVGLVFKPGPAPLSNEAGEIILHLRADPQSGQDLRTVSMPVQKVGQAGNYRFFFQPLPDSNQRDYYFVLEMKGSGEIGIGEAGSETFLDGAAYKNGSADNGQLTFNLKYESAGLYLGLIKETPVWLLWLLISLFIFVIPGWALLSLVWSGWQKLDVLERIGLGSGVSLAIYPVMFLWTNLVGLHLGALYAWLPAGFGLAIILWRNFPALTKRLSLRAKNRYQPAEDERDSQALEKPATLIDPDPTNNLADPSTLRQSTLPAAEQIENLAVKVALLFLVGAIIFTRLWVIRSLDFPLWGDSYQHTVIAQLMIDNRGLFQSWLPYAELSTFTYHFGFHTLVACFDWISGVPIQKAILWVGQIINILAVISLYPLAKKLGKNQWSGVFLFLIAGLVSLMPMDYVNWGRYTQLAGQAILPAAIYFTWLLLESAQTDRRLLFINWVVLGGLALTHYRVLIFIILFYLAWILMNPNRLPFSKLIQRAFWSGMGGALIFVPWLVSILPYRTMQDFLTQLTTLPGQASRFLTEYNLIGDPFEFFPPAIWIGLVITIGWAFWQREKNFIIVILWWGLVFISANPMWIGLPGTGAISNFAVKIGGYIPISIILGAFSANIVGNIQNRITGREKLSPKLKTICSVLISVTLLICVIYSGLAQSRLRLDDINPTMHALATRPDQRAANWIRENTNPEDRFLVNSFFAYGGSMIAGSDGGWWLPLLTSRLSTQPPLNYGSEEGLEPDYVNQTNGLVQSIEKKGLSDPSVLRFLHENRINYVYIGQQQGRVNSPGPLLDIDVLQSDPHFQLVFRQDQVWIFKIID